MAAPLILFFKSHIVGYTKKDGTAVAPHEDKRSKAAAEADRRYKHARLRYKAAIMDLSHFSEHEETPHDLATQMSSRMAEMMKHEEGDETEHDAARHDQHKKLKKEVADWRQRKDLPEEVEHGLGELHSRLHID